MYPIDLLKVCTYVGWHWWQRRGTNIIKQTRMQVVNPTPAAIYSGLGNAIATISRVEGYMSLWRGLSSVIVGAGGFLPKEMKLVADELTMELQAQHTRYTSPPTR